MIALKQNYVIAHDGIFYVKMAKLYSAGQYHHQIFRDYPYYAFFPLLILPFHKVFGDWVLAGQWISVLCGALTVIPLYFLAWRIFGEKVALLAAIFYIVCPILVRYSAEILRDIPFVFFYTTALWWGYKGIRDEKIVFVGLAGLFIALSASLRIEGSTLLVSLLLFVFWHGIKNDVPWQKSLTACGVLLFGAIFVLLLFGFLLTQKGVKLSSGQIATAKIALTSLENETIKNLEREVEEKGVSQKGRSFFYLARKHRFVLYISHIFYKIVKVFNILFLLFLFGLIRRKEIGYRQDEFLLFTIYALFIPVFFLFLNVTNELSTRSPFPVVIPSLIWSAVGFVEFKERVFLWIKERDFALRGKVLRWVTPLLLLLICIPLLSMAWAPRRKNKLELKEIGLWLKNNGYAHSTIVAQGEFSRLVFYADGAFVPLPKGTYQDIIRFAREKGASLLVISERTIDRFSPNFLNLVSSEDLQRIHIPGVKTPQYATLVFRVRLKRIE
ncbi:MAG: ArnT family glycosyltransferase [Candidatus Zixiibacteriota bacterium]